jgi:hypothetical protein
VIGLAVSGQFLMTASGQIPMIFVVTDRLSANRWAQ